MRLLLAILLVALGGCCTCPCKEPKTIDRGWEPSRFEKDYMPFLWNIPNGFYIWDEWDVVHPVVRPNNKED